METGALDDVDGVGGRAFDDDDDDPNGHDGDRPRFTVGGLLASALDGSVGGSAATPDEVADVGSWFRTECARVIVDVPREALPLRLPKDRLAALLTCERNALARLGETELSEPLVRGRLDDLLVAQHLSFGLGDDIEGDLRDALAAQGDREVGPWLDEAGDDARRRVWTHVTATAAGLARTWDGIDRGWWARTQERASVPVADGALVLSAVFDVALGGPPTGRPWVIIEVKSGAVSDRHRIDVLWYALVAALRHGRAPAIVATWTAADAGLVPVAVTSGTLEAAARRGLEGVTHLVGLAGGRPPTTTPNAACGWCPDLDRCPPGQERVRDRS